MKTLITMTDKLNRTDRADRFRHAVKSGCILYTTLLSGCEVVVRHLERLQRSTGYPQLSSQR